MKPNLIKRAHPLTLKISTMLQLKSLLKIKSFLHKDDLLFQKIIFKFTDIND